MEPNKNQNDDFRPYSPVQGADLEVAPTPVEQTAVMREVPIEEPQTTVTLPQQTSRANSRAASLLHFNRDALLYTIGAGVVIALLSLAVVLFASNFRKADLGSNTPVSNLKLSVDPKNVDLGVGEAQKLAVNGLLEANQGLVILPSAAPAKAVLGQIYFDQATNQPYYYNGSKFTPIASDTSALSTGLLQASGLASAASQVASNAQQVAANARQAADSALTQPKVNSLQGLTGNIQLVAGSGVGISGTTITNTGVVSLSAGGGVTITNNGGGDYVIENAAFGAGGAVILGASLPQEDSTNNASIAVDKTGSGNLLAFSSNGTPVFTVDQTGKIINGSMDFANLQNVPTLVNAVGGLSGSLGLGAGLGTSGSNLINTGVVSLTGTANQIAVSASSGNITLSLPQNISAISSPGFANLTLTNNLSAIGSVTSGNNVTQGSVIIHDGTGRSATIRPAVLGQSTIYTLPDPGSANAIICLTTGNCSASGTAGGDLTGSYPNPTIASLQGTTISITGLSTGQFLQYNGTAWANQSMSGDLTINGSGVATIGNGVVTNVKLANSSIAINAGTGLTGGGSASLGGTTNLEVAYGATGGTSVQGNTTLVCASGNGNLSGGGNSITLGAGGSCGSIDITDSPTFAGTLAITGAGGISLGEASTNTGILVLNHASSANQTTLTTAAASQNQIVIIPDSGAATDTVCLLNLGNCAGPGGGVTGSGTQGTFAVFGAGGNTVEDSGLSESAGTLTYNGDIYATGSTTTDGTTTTNGLTVAGVTTLTGTANINTTGTATTGIGNSTGTLTVTGGASSTFVLNGVTVTSTEFNRLSGKDAALLDTNDAANTAITGTGELTAGSIGIGFGVIATGNNISTSATLQGGTVNATTAIQLNGTDINTAGTLTNVAYLNQANIFTAANTFNSTVGVQGGLTLGVASSANGVLDFANSTNSNVARLQAAVPSGAGTATFTLPSIAGGSSDEICTVASGNCAGSGGGITGSGTNGTIAMFNGTGAITDSALVDTGTVLQYAGDEVCTVTAGNCAGSGNGITGSGTTGTFSVFTGAGSIGDSGLSEAAGVLTYTGTVDATSAIQLNGANINTSGTLSNVAYLGQGNGFTGNNTYSGTTTLNGVTTANANINITGSNTLTVGTGTATLGGALGVTGATTLGSTLGVTGAITGSSIIQGTQLISTTSTGTAPLQVASQTLVSNLNADLLDGYHATDFAPATGGNYIAKNAHDTSSANYLGTLLGLTNTNTGYSGVLSLDGSGTASVLTVYGSSSSMSGDTALIFANYYGAGSTGNLINLLNGGSSRFRVDLSGYVQAVGPIVSTAGEFGTAAANSLDTVTNNALFGSGNSMGAGLSNSGNVSLQSGNATNNSGSVTIGSGTSSTTFASTGSINIASGAIGWGTSGSVNISSGGIGRGTVGDVNIQVGDPGSAGGAPGSINIGTTNWATNLNLGTAAENITIGGGSVSSISANGYLTVSRAATFNSSLTVQGTTYLKKGTDFSTNGITNDANFGAGSVIRLTGSSTQTITGIAGGADGRLLTLINAGTNAAIISNNSLSSSAVNRIITGTGADISIPAGAAMSLIYDSGSSVWRATSTAAGVGGSGVNTVGLLGGCGGPSGNGATISDDTICLQAASDTVPGLMTTGAQTLAGDKTLTGLFVAQAGATLSGGVANINASSNFSTNINTGTSTGAVTIGNSIAGAILLQSGASINMVGATNINANASNNTNINTGTSTGSVSIGNSSAGNINLTSNTAVNINSNGNVNLALSGAGNTGVVLQNATDSEAIFQIKNAASENLLTVDALNSNLAIQGPLGEATVSADLRSGNCFGIGWSGSGSGPYAYTISQTDSLVCNVAGGVVAGATYAVSYQVTSSDDELMVVPVVGNNPAMETTGTLPMIVTQYIVASNTDPLIFGVDQTTASGSISNISIRRITASKAAFTVKSSTGLASLEVRAADPSLGNTFVGLNSGLWNTTGNLNTGFGTNALSANISGNMNTGIGSGALQSNVMGSSNTAVGANALQSNDWGEGNSAFGSSALMSNTLGWGNTAVGFSSLAGNTLGVRNTAVGSDALGSNTIGEDNTAIGEEALYTNTTGSNNTALGNDTLASNTTGSSNVAVGSWALSHTNSNGNVGVGAGAGSSDGWYYVLTGGNNTFVGSSSGVSFTSAAGIENAGAIGAQSVVNSSNTLSLGCTAGTNNCTSTTNVSIGAQGYGSLSSNNNPNVLNVASAVYSTGTVATSGSSTTITGTGTSWNSSMVGATIYFMDSSSVYRSEYITAVNSATSLTIATARNAGSGKSYSIIWGGSRTSATGAMILQNTTDSTSAFAVQNASGSNVMWVSTSTNELFAQGIGVGTLTVNTALNMNATITYQDTSKYLFNFVGATNWGMYWNTASNVVSLQGGGADRFSVDLDDGRTVIGADWALTAKANRLVVNGGALGAGAGSRLIVASFGGWSNSEDKLSVHMYRTANGSDWATTNMLFCRDVDNTVAAGGCLGFRGADTLIYTSNAFQASGNLYAQSGVYFPTGSWSMSSSGADFRVYNSVGTAFMLDASGTPSFRNFNSLGNQANCWIASGAGGQLGDCTSPPSADYAEDYPVSTDVDYGDIVSMGTEMVNTYGVDADGNVDWSKMIGQVTRLIKSSSVAQQNTVGIVSDNHSDFTSTGNNIKESDNPMPVALNGRVPVKITPGSDPIQPGDYITTSTDPGKGMKATNAGFVIGKALESWNPSSGKPTVMVYVEQGYWNGPTQMDYIQQGGNATLSGLIVSGTAEFNDINVGGNANIANLTVEDLHVTGTLKTNSLTVTGLTTVANIMVNGHIISAGDAPLTEALGALGVDGTFTVSGNDTAGTITLTTGVTGLSAGDLGRVDFSAAFAKTPKVIISAQDDVSEQARIFPSGKATSGFKLKAGAVLAPNTTYVFDYFVIE